MLLLTAPAMSAPAMSAPLMLPAPAAPVALLPAVTSSTSASRRQFAQDFGAYVANSLAWREQQRRDALDKAWHERSAKAADPVPGTMYGPFINTFGHKDADSCFGEPPAKQLVMIKKSGKDVKRPGAWSYWANQPMEPLPGYREAVTTARAGR